MPTTAAVEAEVNAESPTLTVEETARFLRVGLNQAYAAIREGSIPSLRIGRRILVPRSKLLALIDGDAEESA